MWKSLLTVCFMSVFTLASPVREENEYSVRPIHIINPPVRCPEGMKPDSKGRCRVVWGKSLADLCPEGEKLSEDGICREVEGSPNCIGDECQEVKEMQKRIVESEDGKENGKIEELKSEKKSRRRRADDDERAKQARSKHAFIMMLKKKKMQMMKPKPPPHHPPHHHPESEEEPEEEEEQQPDPPEQPQRLFFGDESCVESDNSTGGCQTDAEIVTNPEANKEFKEWQPQISSESSESSSSSSSSSSDSTGESESEGGSGESEDEVLERAIKIKLMKLFRMKQRYGPALRQWLVTQLREYEDSFDDEKDFRG